MARGTAGPKVLHVSDLDVSEDFDAVVGFVPLDAPRPGAIAKPDFYYVAVDGKEQRATEVCAKYITLTKTMLEAYRAAALASAPR